MIIKIVNTSNNPNPEYQTAGAAAVDLHASLKMPVTIEPNGRALVPTGISAEVPTGYEAQIRPRSGLAIKNGISIVNSPGTIDSDYRGDIGVILINHGMDSFVIQPGDRIAQMAFVKVEQATFEEVDTLDETTRGKSGFGSTNV